ncbi:MAG TPA: hypothetical protein VIM42_05080 [Clostridium sp.]
MSRLQNQGEYNDNRHKRKRDEDHHKRDHVDERHKRKRDEERDEKHHKRDHVDESHKRKHDEENHKKEHNDVRLKSKYDKTNYQENELFNFLKTYIAENINYVPLKNNGKDKNQYLSKDVPLENNVEDKDQDLFIDDGLGNNVEDKEQDLFIDDGLENDVEDKEQDLFIDDGLENDVEDKEQDLFIDDGLENKNYNRVEDVNNGDFLGGKHNTIEKEELSKETYRNQVDEPKIENCKTMVTSKMLTLCENNPHTSEVTAETVTVKIPVVLTESTVTITIESSLKLEDAVLQIIHIRKNVYLNQCKLIPNSKDGKTGILFIDGFIRKSIEYTTKDQNDKGASCGKVKHATVKVPFKCTTRVTFNTYPKFKPNIYQDEVEILRTSNKVFNPCGVDITGRDIREQSFKMIEFFNEKVFCELISAEIAESDILENPINRECRTPLEQGFHDITEKVVLFLTIKLLQNQHVQISKKHQ